jgi:hypothetical protein
MCCAKHNSPINNDATGNSVVLSLLWPQSSQEIQTGRLRQPSLGRSRDGPSSLGFDRFHRCIYICMLTPGRTKSFGSLMLVDLATKCHLVIVCGIIDLIPTSNRLTHTEKMISTPSPRINRLPLGNLLGAAPDGRSLNLFSFFLVFSSTGSHSSLPCHVHSLFPLRLRRLTLCLTIAAMYDYPLGFRHHLSLSARKQKQERVLVVQFRHHSLEIPKGGERGQKK